jgi:hypothetical protein
MTPMDAEGPLLEALTRRLAETPSDFLALPLVAGKGEVDVAAVVSDLLRDLGLAPLPDSEMEWFRPPSGTNGKARKRLRAVLVAAWLFHDPWFRARHLDGSSIVTFFKETVPELAGLVAANALVADADRREELTRLALKALGLRPAGETKEQASDRLQTLSSLERQRVIEEALRAEERARQIREAMARKAAEEAAAQYSEQ